MSEHALANAFDVSEFVLANGVRITVLDHWPRVAKTPPTPKQDPVRVGDGAASAPPAKPKGRHRDGVVTAAKAEPGEPPAHDPNPFDEDDGAASEPPPDAEPALDPNPFDDHAALGPPAKPEGGDRGAVDAAKAEPDEPQPVTAESAPDSKSGFITHLHEDACRRFGTVLGPNANEAHKDHFHLDMKKRRRASYCE
ncbi:MAG: extensin family protein [Methyloceanibacter sp.]|nr:extensin family protein [Methyloceanibacter sp.]